MEHCKSITTKQGTAIGKGIGDNLSKENEKESEEGVNQKEKNEETKLSFGATLSGEGKENSVNTDLVDVDIVRPGKLNR